jgi:hypothetical protein
MIPMSLGTCLIAALGLMIRVFIKHCFLEKEKAYKQGKQVVLSWTKQQCTHAVAGAVAIGTCKLKVARLPCNQI